MFRIRNADSRGLGHDECKVPKIKKCQDSHCRTMVFLISYLRSLCVAAFPLGLLNQLSKGLAQRDCRLQNTCSNAHQKSEKQEGCGGPAALPNSEPFPHEHETFSHLTKSHQRESPGASSHRASIDATPGGFVFSFCFILRPHRFLVQERPFRGFGRFAE